MRLVITTTVSRGLFIDRPGEIYGSARHESVVRYPLDVVKSVYGAFGDEQREEAEKYEADKAEYDRRKAKFDSVSKRRRTVLGMVEPEKPERPVALTPAAQKLARKVAAGDIKEKMQICVDSNPTVVGGRVQVSIRITVRKPDMDAMSVRTANEFNRLGGLNRHAHWIAVDLKRTFETIFRRAVEATKYDLSKSRVEIVDECPLPPDAKAEFDENARRALDEIERSTK